MKPIIGAIFIIAASATIWGCSKNSPGANTSEDLREPVDQISEQITEQAVTERRFVELPTEPDVVFGRDEDLFYPEEVRVAVSGDVYISIGKAGKIHRYSPSGELLQVFGNGPGGGPAEFESIRNFGIEDEGQVWAYDPRQRRYTTFGPDGEMLSTMKPLSPFSQMVASDTGPIGYYGFHNPVFSVVDSDGDVLKEFGYLIESADEIGGGLLFVGYMKSAPSGEYFVYVGMNNGILVSYDSSGKLRFYRHSIGGPVTLELTHTEEGNLTYDRERTPMRFQQIALNIWDDVLYMITVTHDFDESYMDAYDANNGDYLYSMRVPIYIENPCGPDFVTDTTIYMLCDSASSLVAMKRVD